MPVPSTYRLPCHRLPCHRLIRLNGLVSYTLTTLCNLTHLCSYLLPIFGVQSHSVFTHSIFPKVMNFDDPASVSESTRRKVFDRDGDECWLCGHKSESINIAHQIHASAWRYPFPEFISNGTIPTRIDLSHCDNLIPLCASCHVSYDAVYPEWIIIPDIDTLNQYIEHEKKDYDHRHIVAQSSGLSIPRTLPLIDRTRVMYNPLILSPHVTVRNSSNWPKHWQGEPTTVIHRAAWNGLLASNTVKDVQRLQPIQLGNGTWQRGVPTIFKAMVYELTRLWDRPAPFIRR